MHPSISRLWTSESLVRLLFQFCDYKSRLTAISVLFLIGRSKKNNTRLTESYRSRCGKSKIELQMEKPSVKHTKHECTKSQGRECRVNETKWES